MIQNCFYAQNLDQEGLDVLTKLRDSFAEFAMEIEKTLPKGRYQSMSLTALEESAIWASKSITHESDHSRGRLVPQVKQSQ